MESFHFNIYKICNKWTPSRFLQPASGERGNWEGTEGLCAAPPAPSDIAWDSAYCWLRGNSLLVLFFNLKKRNRLKDTGWPESRRQASHTLCKKLWGHETLSSCKETSQNNGPLFKRPEMPPKSWLPPSSSCLKFFPKSAGICSHYLIPHVPTGVTWLEFSSHFILLQPVTKPRSEPAARQQLAKFISVVCSCSREPDNVLWKPGPFSPNCPEPQFDFTTSPSHISTPS